PSERRRQVGLRDVVGGIDGVARVDDAPAVQIQVAFAEHAVDRGPQIAKALLDVRRGGTGNATHAAAPVPTLIGTRTEGLSKPFPLLRRTTSSQYGRN